MANGIAAGQRAQHFMVHIIPRKENDGINFVLPQKSMEEKDIEAVGNKLVSALGGSAEAVEKPAIPANVPEPKKKEGQKSESGINLDDISKLLGVK
ncbi:hypothetical protein HYX03_00815 [Candidatus Woesearchaeota archaeon]|nr:hypothetical protein [Candidatus Woesearchaeota archaeon]